MKIFRNLEHEAKYMNKLREYLGQSPREGVHVSDLINPRKAFFKRVSPLPLDRKSTRLNSSHGYISYAVFCLIKGKQGGRKAWSCTSGGGESTFYLTEDSG